MITEEAIELNNALARNSFIFRMLSSAGKKAFFPKKGILQQTAEAKTTRLNATIGQAFEDDGLPMVLDSLERQISIKPQEVFLYSPSPGQKELRDEWKKSIQRKNQSLQSFISTPIVTGGITHALSIVGRLFVNQEEGIITPDRFWENYTLTFDSSFNQFPLFYYKRFNIEGLARKLVGRDSKKIILLNFPNNPTGYTPTQAEAEEIKQVIKEAAGRNNLVVAICDDAYFGLVYEKNVEKESMFSKLAGLDERVLAIKVDGISKEMYAWGLRIGFITYGIKGLEKLAAAALEDKTAGIVRATISNASTLSQTIAINALKSPQLEAQAAQKFEELRARYQIVKQTLNEHPEYSEFFEALPFNSGYFMCVQLKNLSPDKIRKKLIEEFSTGVIAGEDTLRIAYSAVNKSMIPALFDNIYQAAMRN